MLNISNAEQLLRLLDALDRQLSSIGEPYELVVIGGSGMLALRIGARPTHDVDLLALRSKTGLERIDDLPEPLKMAANRVAIDFGLEPDWLNPGPTSLMDLGLPNGFEDRLRDLYTGRHLVVRTASREDQVHFKLYALVDQGRGKHEQDLDALDPTEQELLDAATWARTHDPSDGFKSMIVQTLEFLGVKDAADKV